MSYYPEPNRHIRDKFKVVLDMPTYATKKKLEHAAGIHTSDLAAKKIWKLNLTNSTLRNWLMFQLVWII